MIQTVLFTLCALNELFFIAVYLLSFSSPILSPALLQTGGESSSMQPGSPAAPSMIWTTPWSAGAMEMARYVTTPQIRMTLLANISRRANKMDSKVPWTLAGISVLGMLLKQYINVLQLVNASQWLAEGDRAQRKKLGLPRRKTR
jgi:CDP-diacylglycerol--inositol 3-phosphatidyltransferase